MMDKNSFAVTPPMGWNSYDHYDTTVNEEQVRANAEFMAENLKEFGWEYIVIDIQWYAYNTGSQRDRHQYIPFSKLEMDEYSRLLPCPDRFPSSIGGKGFKPLADYIHGLGLKFGIHIMRGIPRIAAHLHACILGTDKKADQIADPSSICFWNPDMYGLVPGEKGSQEYYDSIFTLYAEWGVDFIKCDDICRMDAASAREEIEMLYRAIQNCGRPMVLSLSPGPALIEEAGHYKSFANMWRITDDLWDNWPDILDMFRRCGLWQEHVSEGCYPDCDMLPLGIIGKGFGNERSSRLSKEEQKTMMTLWCIFRSPLMTGSELTLLDDRTLGLLTNRKVLRLLSQTRNNRQLERNDEFSIWTADDTGDGSLYIALFNFLDKPQEITLDLKTHGLEKAAGGTAEELWTDETSGINADILKITAEAHGVKLFRIVPLIQSS